jgi:hypothetical protein
MPLFGERDRETALTRALELLKADPRIEAAILAGSLGLQSMDRWSDLDLDAVIRAGESTERVASDWVDLVYREWPVVHHYETSFGSSLVRGFLLDNGLVLDFGFDPVEDFSVWAPVRVAFDRTGTATRAAAAPEEWTPTPDWRGESGFAWHDVLHACSAAARGKGWQSLYFIQRVRNRTLALACERHGLDADEFKHTDELPAEEREPVLASLVGDLSTPSLLSAVEAATRAFLDQLRRGDPELAEKLGAPLLNYVGATREAASPSAGGDQGPDRS